MPDYDDYPVEGYIYSEPTGRPQSGKRYRNPAGDNRVLWSLVTLFVLGCVAIGGFAWMERKNTLTEWAFGDDRHECRLQDNGSVFLRLVFDVAEVKHKRPEVFDAPGFVLAVDVKTLQGRDDVVSIIRLFNTRDIAWDSAGVIFDAEFDVAPSVAVAGDPVGICDVELAPLASAELLTEESIIPRTCNVGDDAGDYPAYPPIPALNDDGSPCG